MGIFVEGRFLDIDSRLLKRDFWQQTLPTLTLSHILKPSDDLVEFDDRELEGYCNNLRTEAFFITRAVIPLSVCQRIITGIDQICVRRFDATWTLMFDDCWLIYSRLRQLIIRMLGDNYQYVTGNYAFVIPNSDTAAGWGVHRDLPYRRSVRADGMPEIMSFWIALTDATPQNSCLYCLPASRDPNYPHNLEVHSIPKIEDIECMSVKAGQLIGLNHALLHWGSRSSSRGQTRRVSIVFDVQRADVPGYHEALVDSNAILSFEQRAAYIAHNILWLNRYNVNFSKPNLDLAAAFVRAFGDSIGLRKDFLVDYYPASNKEANFNFG